MTEIEQHACEVPDCDHPAPTTAMCWDCVQEILDALASVTATHWMALEQISRREQAAQTLSTSGEGGHQPAGPCEPMNLTALAILQDLTRWDALSAADWSTTEDPAWWHHWIPTRCRMAVTMVDGETEDKPTPEYVRYRIEQEGALDPMPVGTATKWLAKHGILVDKKRVGMWAARKQIHPDERGPAGEALYAPATIVAKLYPTQQKECA